MPTTLIHVPEDGVAAPAIGSQDLRALAPDPRRDLARRALGLRDTPAAAAADVTDRAKLLDRLFGAWAGADELDELIREIYEARSDL